MHDEELAALEGRGSVARTQGRAHIAGSFDDIPMLQDIRIDLHFLSCNAELFCVQAIGPAPRVRSIDDVAEGLERKPLEVYLLDTIGAGIETVRAVDGDLDPAALSWTIQSS